MVNAVAATPAVKIKKSSEFKRIMKQLRKNKLAMVGLYILLAEVLLAILAPIIIPYDVTFMDTMNMFSTPTAKHWFGCDEMGRDIFSRILYGSRYSLTIGIAAMIVSNFFGMIIGGIAGFFGGWVDNLIMRVLDIIQAIPGMLMLVVLSALLGPGFGNTILALSVGGISGSARMLRAQMLKERGMEYVEAEYSINCSRPAIIVKHLIPNCMSPMIVSATMGVAQTISTAAGLSFLGLGVQPPMPEWGAMLAGARQYMRQAPHMLLIPGAALAITVLSLNLLGDGLRDAMDPKLMR